MNDFSARKARREKSSLLCPPFVEQLCAQCSASNLGAFILWQSANNYRLPRKVKLGILAVTNKETSRMMNGSTHQQCQLVVSIIKRRGAALKTGRLMSSDKAWFLGCSSGKKARLPAPGGSSKAYLIFSSRATNECTIYHLLLFFGGRFRHQRLITSIFTHSSRLLRPGRALPDFCRKRRQHDGNWFLWP